MNAHRWVGAVLVVGAAVWGYGLLFPSPEDEIRRQLDALAEVASVAPGATNLERMARAARLGRFVGEDVVIDLGGRLSAARGRQAVVGVAARTPSAPTVSRSSFWTSGSSWLVTQCLRPSP